MAKLVKSEEKDMNTKTQRHKEKYERNVCKEKVKKKLCVICGNLSVLCV